MACYFQGKKDNPKINAIIVYKGNVNGKHYSKIFYLHANPNVIRIRMLILQFVVHGTKHRSNTLCFSFANWPLFVVSRNNFDA